MLRLVQMFSSMSLIVLLGSPLTWILEAVFDVVAALACLKRIDTYLSKPAHASHLVPSVKRVVRGQNHDIELEEIDLRTRGAALTAMPDREVNAIETCKASFSWTAEGRPTLNNIDLSVPKGRLAMLIGPVASGKTTLPRGLLGEAPRVAGDVALLPLRLSWCEQTPWLLVSKNRPFVLGDATVLVAEIGRTIPSRKTSSAFLTLSRNSTGGSSTRAIWRRTSRSSLTAMRPSLGAKAWP